jgi:hypothetical protein
MTKTDQAFLEMLLPSGEWFTPAQLAAALGRSESYVRDQIETGNMGGFRAAGRAPRPGERRIRTEANSSCLVHRRDALLWLVRSYNQTPDEFEQRVCDLINRLPQTMLWRVREHLNRRLSQR